MFIDAHAHLDDQRFDQDRQEVIEKLNENEIELVINAGADLESSLFSKRLAEENESIYFTAGIHPHEAKTANEEVLNKIEALLKHPKCVATGEIGLDYHYNHSMPQVQREVFAAQLEIAQRVGKPIVVHMREATKDTIDILQRFLPLTHSGVIHSFSGSAESGKIFLEMGLYLSISGPITYENAERFRQVVRSLPLEKLLIETDCPYLTPVPLRGKRNEPKNVRYVAQKIAELKGSTLAEVARITSGNARKVFGLTKT